MPENSVGDAYPKLTQFAADRLNNAVGYTPQPNKVPYLGYFKKDDTPYDLTDYPEVRKRITGNITDAIATRFPLESDKYILSLENLHYLDKEFTPKDEKDALLHGKTLGTRLRGDWVLYDKASGKEIQRKANNTLLNIPYLTDRGVFIRSGNEYGLRNMFRLRPGMYTRIRNDGYIATHVNPAQGTGRQSNIILNPEDGVFTWKMGTRNYGLLPLLLASGKSPEEIRKAWGDELFDNNYKKYEGIITGSSKREAEEYQKLWNEDISRGILDEETTESTLGRPHKNLTGDAVLDATNKILRVAQTYSDKDTDNRDGLQYQTIMGAADYLPERIVRDGGGMFRKILNKIDSTGNLDSVTPGIFQPHVDAVFQEDRHAGYIDGANPLEAVDFSSSLSRIGEGGLGTDRAASEESRGVHNSYLGFVDPIRSAESQSVGLQVFINHGVKKDSSGRLWTMVRTPGDPKPHYQDMHTLAKSVVATPEYFNPEADPNEFIPAFRNGGDLEYIPRKEVDYYIADSSNMMSDNTGFIAGIGGIRSNRTLLGSKASIQALSLPNRETPLVQRYLSTEDGDTTTEAFMGKKLGAKFAQAPGVVESVDEDKIVYRGQAGKLYTVNLYNNLPANNKGWLTNTPVVKPGDIVKPGQLLAKSNYTDDNGNAATGVNLRVAYVSAPEGGSSLDAITVSESAAKTKLASEQLYKTKAPKDNETEYSKERFLRAFDTSEFTKEQLDTLDENGVVKPGTVLHKGDPMILGISLHEPGIHGVSKKGIAPLIKTWDHDYTGTVMDIGDSNKNYTVITKSQVPAKVGDKMCYSEDTDILTGNRGWVPIKELTLSDTVYTVNPETGVMELQQPTKVFRYEYAGSMYHIETPQLDLLVTPNHQNLVDVTSTRHKFVDKFELVSVSELFGKRAMYKKDGIWASDYREKYELPGYTEKCGQFGHGTKVVEPAYRDPETFLPLLGLWLAEGSATIVPGNYIVSIAQKTPEKCIKLEKILNNSGYKWYLNGRNYIIRDKQLTLYLKRFGYCYQKYIPEEVFRYSADIQRLFFAGIMLGDGSYNKQGRPVCYTTTSRRLADDMVRLCLNIGYAANVQIKPMGEPVWFERDQRYIVQRRPCYSVRIITNKLNPKVHFHNKPSEKNHTEEWMNYTGYVYCCEVPKYHTLYVRRNDKPVWSGNSTTFGNKGVIGKIIPDDEMLQDANGQPFEVYQSPMGIPSRVNPMVLASLQLGKIAKHTGKPIVWKDFSDESTVDKVLQMLKDNGLEESETLYDPQTGKQIPDVDTGYLYYLKFKHLSDVKEKARGTGDYTMEDLPLKGGDDSARRFGSMEIGALHGHGGIDSEIMKDTKLIRGQENNAFWKAVRNGDTPPTPDTPLVHKKFFAHLQAAGVNLEDRGNRIHMFAADDNDIKNLTQNRQVINNSTYDAKELRPIQGGLFDPAIFGAKGDQWAYYKLPEPILNPLMEKPVSQILGWKEKDLQGVLNGEEEINGKTGAEAVWTELGKLNLEHEYQVAKQQLKSTNLPALKRDKILKKYRAIAGLLREHKDPRDMFLTRIPILPPRFRPVSVLGNDVGIVSDANYLYKAMIDASTDFEDAKKTLPPEMQLDARKGLHEAVKAVIGLTDSPDKKLQDKGVEGVLKWAFGKGSPKFGSLHRKVFGATADLGGLAVATPDAKLGMDEIGLPEDGAWNAFEPFVVRNLRRQGISMQDAIQMVQERTPRAEAALKAEMEHRPVLVNRAPTMHKYNILAFWPRLTKGKTVSYNPLVSKGYNLDSDGDVMSFHVPVSKKAVDEAIKKMLPSRNLYSPSTLKAHVLPLEEFSQGLYIASRPGKGTPVRFRTKADMLRALNAGEINYDTPVDILDMKK